MKDWIYMTINHGMMLIMDMVQRSLKRELKQGDHELVNQKEETKADENAGGFTDDIGNGPEKLGSEGGDVHAYDEFKLEEAVDVDEEKEEHHDDLHDRSLRSLKYLLEAWTKVLRKRFKKSICPVAN
ncbi:hypothetical protein Bca52824_001874 [Brassica carinata]|uniref:Uncharacterized protein n=1 Tax=Brassica carinata TaxID=52824 RepID=A0A8X7WJ56_BRACI|nr:hypothetical protein Bca52824_001874 [Brassica carinata]